MQFWKIQKGDLDLLSAKCKILIKNSEKLYQSNGAWTVFCSMNFARLLESI